MIENNHENHDGENFRFPEEEPVSRAERQEDAHQENVILSREAEAARAESEAIRLGEVRETIHDSTTMSEPKLELDEKTQVAADAQTEIVSADGVDYTVKYVSRETIYPAYGYATGNVAEVREDLPPRMKKFVRAHELYHCRDKATWGGEFGRELRANIVPSLKDPIGLLITAGKTITDRDRLKFYLDRIRRS